MYGAMNDQFITELGFIVEDIECTQRVLQERADAANQIQGYNYSNVTPEVQDEEEEETDV